ncbi:MAG: hypothetical protein LR011_06290, partial [Verrucomicrobia bacterium]|nr:hypothetical protein [Verrucomicrobiota bacterium]
SKRAHGQQPASHNSQYFLQIVHVDLCIYTYKEEQCSTRQDNNSCRKSFATFRIDRLGKIGASLNYPEQTI